jgi:hypothetical protein
MDTSGLESAKTRIVVSTPSCNPQPPAGPPGSAKMTLLGGNSVVTWPGTAAVRYQAECSTDFGLTWTPVGPPTTTFGSTNVRVGNIGVYRVAWFTNTAEYKNNYALFAGDVSAPTEISTYDATELTGGNIRLDWSASSDTQSGLKGYLLYRDDAFLAFSPNGVTTYTDSTGQGTSSTYDIAALDRAGNVSAKVSPSCKFTLSANSWTAPAGGGGTSVYVTSSRSICTWSVSNPYNWLSVTPANGTSSGWVSISAANNGTGSSRSGTVTIGGKSYSVSQNSTVCNYSITTSSSPGGSASGGGTVNCGSSVTVSATANSGYTFANWTENGGVVSSSANYTFTANANRNLVANFAACNYSITTSASPSAGGTASGGGTVSCGSSVTVNATPNSGYSFNNWTENGTPVSSSSSYAFTANANRNLVANFSPNPCSLSVSPNSSSFGNSGGSGSFIAYTTCVRTSTPSAGWITITGGGSGSGNGTVSFSVAANTGPARNGSITVSVSGTSQAYTINQDAAVACSQSLTPTNVFFSSMGGSGSSIVTISGGCTSWTASTTNTWLTITSGSSGSGSGTVTYSINANSSTTTDRIGKITLVGNGQNKVITVNQNRNYAPTVNPGANSTATVGVAAAFDGSLSHDPESTDGGYIASYQWNFGDGSSASGATTSHAYNSAGTYTVTLTATDNQGAPASATKTVTVSAPLDTTPPTASLTAPSAGATLTSTATFSGTASDNVGVTRVEFWCDGSLLLGTDTTAPFSVTYDTAGIANGARSFTCKAFDAAGNSAVSPAIAATVSNGTVPGQLVRASVYGSTGFDYGQDITVDKDGNVVTTGFFDGRVDFGGGPLPLFGSKNIFLAKHSGSGDHIWSKGFGGSGSGKGLATATDSQGGIFLAGQFGGTLDFGGGPLTGWDTPFIAKFSSTGAHVWSRSLGGIGVTKHIAVDASGNVVVTGSSSGTADFGAGIFVAKYSGATGTPLWSKTFGGAQSDSGNGIAIDGLGNIVVVGAYSGSINFGGGLLTSSATDIFVAKFSASGGHLWSKRFGSVNRDSANAVAVDGNGNVLVTGVFMGTVDFGGGQFIANEIYDDAFVLKLSAAGSHIWSKELGGSAYDFGNAIAVDSSGNVVVTGSFMWTADFGGGPVSSAGGQDVFAAKYSGSDGGHIWSKTIGAAIGSDEGLGATVDPAGNTLVVGRFFTTVNFGDGLRTSAGECDIFVAKFRP